MDSFKIKNFQLENPGRVFPPVRQLSPEEARGLRTKLRDLLQLEAGADDLDLTALVRAISTPLPGVNAEEPAFSLTECLLSQGIRAQRMVYVNWYRYDEVDELLLEDLSNNLQHIWYPAADDIEIFDRTCSWIATIEHTGDVGLLRVSDATRVDP